MDLIMAHRLAQEIEWIHAKDRARLRRRGRQYTTLKQDAEQEYDPLAATCLGDLIYNVAKQQDRRSR